MTTSSSHHIRLLIADAQELSRRGLRAVLAADSGIDIVGESADGRDALHDARIQRPDIAIVDHDLPPMGGLELARRFNEGEAGRVIRSVVLSSSYSDEALSNAVRLRVGGYLNKSCPAAELIAAVQAVSDGAAFLSADVTRRLFERFQLLPAHPFIDSQKGLMGLSQREVDVVRSIGGALSNREIALKLGVAETTVKSHVSRLLTKLDMRDRVQVALLAVRLGLVPLYEATPPLTQEGSMANT